MKNKELTYNKVYKVSKKNIAIIIIPIILTLILITIIFYYCIIYNSPKNKLKRYLENYNYVCSKNICTKQKDNAQYSINLKKINFEYTNLEYEFFLSESKLSLNIIENEMVCNYTQDKSTFFSEVDKNSTSNSRCKKYIEDVNKYIEYFEDIIESSEVDVNDLKK